MKRVNPDTLSMVGKVVSGGKSADGGRALAVGVEVKQDDNAFAQMELARQRALLIEDKAKKGGFKRPLHKLNLGAIFHLEHWRGDKLLAERHEENLCPDEFINYMLDVGLSDATQLTDWYVLIFNDNHTPAAGNTYGTPGFTESTDYDETTRPAWVEAGVSSKVITNSASKATFTMAGTDTSIYGAAIVGGVHATDGDIDTKGDSAASPGVLGPEAQFTGGAVTGIVDDDVLKVYVTITGSDV